MSVYPDPFASLLTTPPPRSGSDLTLFAPPTHENDVGRLGPYRVLRYLRRASIGSIYLGFDLNLNRSIWLKVLRPNYLANPEARSRFLCEARNAATIKSNHVIQVFEVSELNGLPYVAIEHLHGRTLEEHLATHPVMPWKQILRLARETCKGLADAHAMGVPHRELKPDTIWLEAPKGTVKLIDFGHVRPRVESNSPLMNQSLIGLSPYSAPERAKNTNDDPRSDLFSLGVILYRLATKELPFSGLSPLEILTSILTDPPVPVSQRNPDTPPELARLIMQLLEKQMLLRPPSAAAVVDRLKEIETTLKPDPNGPVDLKISICPDGDTALIYRPKSVNPPNGFGQLIQKVSKVFRSWKK